MSRYSVQIEGNSGLSRYWHIDRVAGRLGSSIKNGKAAGVGYQRVQLPQDCLIQVIVVSLWVPAGKVVVGESNIRNWLESE